MNTPVYHPDFAPSQTMTEGTEANLSCKAVMNACDRHRAHTDLVTGTTRFDFKNA